MFSAPTLLQSVQLAFTGASAPRNLALALLRGAFLGGPRPKAAEIEAPPPRTEWPSTSDCGSPWRKLHLPGPGGVSHELALVDALARHADAEAILLLAGIVRLPAPAAERALFGPDADALLILARAANLAWSTMRSLLALRERLLPASAVADTPPAPALDQVAIAFDEFPRPVAERALRFIRAFATAAAQAPAP